MSGRPAATPSNVLLFGNRKPIPEAKLSADMIQRRLTEKLAQLDGEQLQIVEIVVGAIVRGAR